MQTRPFQFTSSLWMPICAPAIWAMHFLLSYISVAVACARTPNGSSGWRALVGVYTVVAVFGLAVLAYQGWIRRCDTGRMHGFLGQLTVGLSALSACATLVVALPALFYEGCR